MKLNKLMKKLQEFLDADSRKRKDHRKDMKVLLRKLKEKEKNLAAKTVGEFEEEKLERLHKEIDMVHAQRKKGISALKGLNEKQESNPKS